MAASIIFYAGAVLLVAGLVAAIHPFRFLGIRGRRVAGAIATVGLILSAGAIAWPSPRTRTASPGSRLDEFMPAWQFSERHTIHIAASPGRTFEAIRGVRANEIALFRALTWIRRAGRSGPESILNASGQKPLLEVATRSGFILLADEAPRELVIGSVIVAPPDAKKSGRLTNEMFTRALRPGVALTTMNFLVTPDGHGGSNLSTETRVYANDRASLRAFTTYWRIIQPGSDIIRRMWLRAIRRRAELTSPES